MALTELRLEDIIEGRLYRFICSQYTDYVGAIYKSLETGSTSFELVQRAPGGGPYEIGTKTSLLSVFFEPVARTPGEQLFT